MISSDRPILFLRGTCEKARGFYQRIIMQRCYIPSRLAGVQINSKECVYIPAVRLHIPLLYLIIPTSSKVSCTQD